MKKNEIIWTYKALSDLDVILEYINQNAGIEQANYVLKGIETAVNEIYPFPLKFSKEPLLDDDNVRFIVKWSYKIIYEVFDNHVEIDHIYHTSRDLHKLIKEID